MRQQNTSAPEENKQEKKRRREPLFLLLLLLTLITSCIAGYILGRHTGTDPLGQVIDTIVLTPEKEPVSERETFHLTGQVCYTDGTPAVGRTLELHSDPIIAVTDSKGGFLFPNVPQGEHTIYVRNNDGTTAAQREIHVTRENTSEAVSVDLMDSGEYVIELAIDVRVLEIVIELGSGELYINPENISYATLEGMVTTPEGTASLKDGVVVTPGGNVYLPDGNIILPGGAKEDPTYIIQPDDTVIVNRPLVSGGIEVDEDGTVIMPDNTVIEPGGIILLPDGTPETPGHGGVIVGDGNVIPIGGQVPENTQNSPSGEPEAEQRPQPSPIPERTDAPSVPGSPEGQENMPGETEINGENTPSSPPVQNGTFENGGEAAGSTSPDGGNSGGTGQESGGGEPPASDNGVLEVSGQNKEDIFTSWEQDSLIDLFYNRSTGRAENIAPGSKGYYLFRLQNTRKEKLAVTLRLTEEFGPHLPLRFTLKPDNQTNGGTSGILTQTDGLSLAAEIGAGETVIYRLDWEWPFESGNDTADTDAGKEGGSYVLKLAVYAEGNG